MSEKKRDHEVGRGKPPVHARFKKGQSGNPRGPRQKPAGAVDRGLNEPMIVTIEGERREITGIPLITDPATISDISGSC